MIAAALGYVFVKYTGAIDARTARCETREDSLLEDSRATTGILKELSAATLRSVDIAEDAFTMGKATHDALSAAVSRNDAAIKDHASAISRNTEILTQIMERLDRFEQPTQRRSRAGDKNA
jgi:hypothetical protein